VKENAMLTIRAMAEMGPWIFDHIHILDGLDERCQRCSTPIKNVWVMEMQTEPKVTQRIGSCCGPKLEELSAELWKTTTAPFALSLRHMQTLARILECEAQFPQLAPREYPVGWAAEQQRLLAKVLTKHERRVMGSRVSRARAAWQRAGRRYDAALKEQERNTLNSLPTNAHH
jgi:hypothetical protein